MNTITLTLCASTRTGCLSAPIHSCADERLTLAGDLTLSAGTSVALITPRGDTLAHTILSEECAPGATIPLSTLTAQAAEYTRSCRAGDTREALLALGDSEHPLALIPARIAQNPLYTLAPPTDLAPAYPTTETLKSLLAEMQATSNAAAQSATAARKSAEKAGESASSAASDRATAVYSATSAQSYAEVATAAQARSSTSASEASTSAANAASSAASARDAASSAISAANSAAGSASKAAASADSAAFALTASTNAANRAEVAAEKAREADISAANSATAASQSAAAAAQAAADGVATLLQDKVDAADAAKAGAEAAKTAAETAKASADAAKTAAASSATAAANSAAAAKQSATDLADAVATAESLDGRISTIENYGTQYKRDFRIDTTGLVNPLVTSPLTSSPFASIYRRSGYDGFYFSDCQNHIFNSTNIAYIYDASGKYLGRITNTGSSGSPVYELYRHACMTTQIGDYRYGVFNGFPYNNNKMIISKFARNADNTDYELVASRVYAKRGVEGAIFQWGGNLHYVGPVVPSMRTGHILVFGVYYMSVKNDEGTIVDQSIGYGYIVFDSDLNFVKWDETAGAFVSSETFDMSYFHAVSGRASGGMTAYWIWQDAQYLSLVAIQQETNATNGLYYVDPHNNLVPITFSIGPYANAGIDYLPLGGSLLSVDSDALFSTYAPRIVMSGVESDVERDTIKRVKIINGARIFYIQMTKTDKEPGCTFTYRNSQKITKTQFNGSRISDNKYIFLHGRFSSSYSETQLFLYRDGNIYSSDGKYVKSISIPLGLVNISPQRGMYARKSHLLFAPCGEYAAVNGAVLLDM